jgi:hypothetical protein
MVSLYRLDSIYVEIQKQMGIEFNTNINVHNLYEPVTRKTQMLQELQQSHLTIIYTWLSHL